MGEYKSYLIESIFNKKGLSQYVKLQIFVGVVVVIVVVVPGDKKVKSYYFVGFAQHIYDYVNGRIG